MQDIPFLTSKKALSKVGKSCQKMKSADGSRASLFTLYGIPYSFHGGLPPGLSDFCFSDL